MGYDDAIAQGFDIAMRSGLAGSIDELRSRSIIADLDLLDSTRSTIPRTWQQPVIGSYTTAEVDTLIYGDINNSSDKVVIFTGVQNLQKDVYTASIRIDRGSVGVIGLEGTQDLESNTDQLGSKSFSRYYTFAPRERPNIYFHPSGDGVGKKDKIAMLGIVIERAGTTTA